MIEVPFIVGRCSANLLARWEKPLHLLPLPALLDNYIWLLHDGVDALVVDPGEAAPVETALDALSLRLCAILLTHHHPDHIGGAAALSARHGAVIYAPRDPRIAIEAERVSDGDRLRIDAPRAHFLVMAVPGHTLSHVAFYGEGLLFAGDTLFSMGCGRLFEGTPAQMLASMDQLRALPAATRLCCGHEYTQANGRFAMSLDVDNQALAQRVDDVAQLRAAGHPSLPIDLGTELATNPFLRSDADTLRAWAAAQGVSERDRAARFGAIRAAKDAFKG